MASPVSRWSCSLRCHPYKTWVHHHWNWKRFLIWHQSPSPIKHPWKPLLICSENWDYDKHLSHITGKSIEYCQHMSHGPNLLPLNGLVSYDDDTLLEIACLLHNFVPMFIYLLAFLFHRRLLGVITKKDVLRHVKQMDNEDPNTVLFN